MKHWKRYLWGIIAVVAALAAFGLTGGFRTEPRLQYWQRQTAKIHVGMTREEAEAILPRQSFDGWLWGLEDWRMRHARWLPPLKHMREFQMIHYDAGNTMGYEVDENVFVTIRYDLAGSAPGLAIPGQGTVQPKDCVVTAPDVIATPADPSEFLKQYLYKYLK